MLSYPGKFLVKIIFFVQLTTSIASSEKPAYNKTMYYDNIYKTNNNFCGMKPNKLLIKVSKLSKQSGSFLDLGCGQGRDSFYMARKNFQVIAVDNSRVAINQIKKILEEKKIANLQAICQDIAQFRIAPHKFNVINCHNALQFLKKKDALKTIQNIKRNILPKGFIIITSFTSLNSPSKRRKCHFELGEMNRLFSPSQFKIHYYFEDVVIDTGHVGQPEPHKHGIVQIIAEKK